jgi:type II secretory pathway component PulC
LINNRNPKQLVRLGVTVVVALICVYLLVLIGLQYSESDADDYLPVERVKSTQVIYWDWFRSESSSTENIVQTDEKRGELPDANINAVLLGVMMLGDNATATLKFNGKPETVYRKGDDIKSGYRLVDIEPYRIVVRQNGTDKQVLLKKPDSIIETSQVPDAVQQEPQKPQEGFALGNMFGAVPVENNGSAGLKLNNLSADVRSLADIRNGDVVLAVDGMSVQELMANPAQWMSYSNSNSLPVTIMRQGQEETIYVNAASLSAKMLPNLGLSR